jgi:hypothetical protein
MLHLYFKWRYDRQSRKGAFKLPKTSDRASTEAANLSSFLSQTSSRGGGFKPYDLPRKRRKWAQIIALVIGVLLIAWITYESIAALAMLSK